MPGSYAVFNGPNTSRTDSAFGTINSVSLSRVIQMGLRLAW